MRGFWHPVVADARGSYCAIRRFFLIFRRDFRVQANADYRVKRKWMFAIY
jgi:hypothetical protein